MSDFEPWLRRVIVVGLLMVGFAGIAHAMLLRYYAHVEKLACLRAYYPMTCDK